MRVHGRDNPVRAAGYVLGRAKDLLRQQAAIIARLDALPARLAADDRDLITRARQIGPALRAASSDRDREAGWLLKELADLAERLDAAQTTEDTDD